jgi:dTDP-glucose 4,6-dehydratase
VVITRCVNNYGPWQHPEKAVPLFTISALVGHPLPVYGTGKNKREWIHAEDHSSALLKLLRKKNAEGETYNIGTAERLSTMQVARAVVDAADRPREMIRMVADRPGHVLSHAVNSNKLREETGWSPRHSFKESIPDIVKWYAENTDWWRETVLGSARTYFEGRHPDLIKAVRKSTSPST